MLLKSNFGGAGEAIGTRGMWVNCKGADMFPRLGDLTIPNQLLGITDILSNARALSETS